VKSLLIYIAGFLSGGFVMLAAVAWLLGSGRLRDIIESCERDNRYFICHQLAYYPDSTRRRPKRFEAVCAGWLDAARRRRYGPPAIMQIAERLDVVVLVEPPS
jgi:hypothetical protein